MSQRAGRGRVYFLQRPSIYGIAVGEHKSMSRKAGRGRVYFFQRPSICGSAGGRTKSSEANGGPRAGVFLSENLKMRVCWGRNRNQWAERRAAGVRGPTPPPHPLQVSLIYAEAPYLWKIFQKPIGNVAKPSPRNAPRCLQDPSRSPAHDGDHPKTPQASFIWHGGDCEQKSAKYVSVIFENLASFMLRFFPC